ncbi:MAG: WD40 repeat domain-containing protein, partial [Verrucomicrobiaceae bacterium]
PSRTQFLSWVRDGFAWDAAALAGPSSAPRPVSLAAMSSAYKPVMALALSPDGSRLAAGCGNEVLLFKLDPAGPVLLARAQAHPDTVQSMAWMPDGKILVTGAFRRVVVWNTENLTLLRETVSGLTDRISSILVLPQAPGQAVLADGLTAESGVVRVLDTGSGRILRSWTAHADTIYAMALSHDGKHLATAGGDKLVKLWDPATGTETARLEAHSSQVLSVAFNPDDTQLITGGADRQLKVWDAGTRGNLISLPVRDSAFNALDWSTSGAAVFAVMNDGAVMKYTNFKAHTGAQSSETGNERRLGKVESALYCLTVSPDGERFFAGSHDGTIFGWDKEGKPMDPIRAATVSVPTAITPPPP